MIDLKRYKIIIFDCDGVIFDSNDIKTIAFYESVKEFGEEKAGQFVKYHKENGGVSRYKKFDYFFDTILKDNSYDIKYYTDMFGSIVKKRMLYSQFTDGFIKFIELLPQNVTKYVVSGSDQSELRELLKIKGIDRYFNGIYGSPDTKVEIVKEYIDCLGKKVLFIGDSESDYETAKCFGFEFMFIEQYSLWEENKWCNFHYRYRSFKEYNEGLKA